MWTAFEKEINNIKDNIKIPGRNDLKSVERTFKYPNNPGLLRDINRYAENVYPRYFGGLNAITKSQYSGDLDYILNINLDKSDYEASQPQQVYIRRNLVNTAIFEHNLSSQVKCTILAQANGTMRCGLDYFDKKCTGSVAISNVGLNDGKVSVGFLQEVDKKLAAGAKVGLQTGNYAFNLALRYFDSARKCVYSGCAGTKGVQACCFKRIDPKLSVSTIANYQLSSQKIVVSGAVQYLHDIGTLKASLDTNGILGVNLSKSVYREDIDVALTLSAFTNFKRIVKAGVGFEILL